MIKKIAFIFSAALAQNCFANITVHMIALTPQPFFVNSELPINMGYSFVISNPTSLSTTVDIMPSIVWPGLKGTSFASDHPLKDKKRVNLSLAQYVHYFPMHFTLGPNQSEVVGVYLNMPKNLLPATYYENIRFNVSNGSKKVPKTKSNKMGINLNYNIDRITSLYISNGIPDYTPITVACHLMPNQTIRLNIHNPTAYVFSAFYQVSTAGQNNVILDSNPGSVLPQSDAVRVLKLLKPVIKTQQIELTWAMHYQGIPIHAMVNCIDTPLPKLKPLTKSQAKPQSKSGS